jgi:hypothetical protein
MRGRFLIAAVLLLVATGVWSQQSDSDAGTSEPVVIVVESDDSVLIIGDDAFADDAPDIVIRSADYDEDAYFVLEWGGIETSETRGLREFDGVQYRTVPINIAFISPFELFPFENKQVVGLAIDTLYGATASVIGIQAGVVNRVFDRLYGIQAGAVNLSGGVSYGVRFAGLFTTGVSHGGISISGLGHIYSGDGSFGLMVGVYNQTGSFTGLQIGAVNNATHLRGVQLGALNINQDGRIRVMPGINFGW